MPTDPRDHRTDPPASTLPEGNVVVRDHRGDPPPPPHLPPPPPIDPESAIIRDHRPTAVKHVFVLMLENRSFDHMLGFSGITGTDAATGKLVTIDGLRGNESNAAGGKIYTVSRGAPDTMEHGPGHDFAAVLEQLCGSGSHYPSHGPYPAVAADGYAVSYARQNQNDPGAVMKCFDPDQVPVLTALAREFVVCDRWFSSMPGPTEPNRWFVHTASAGQFDDSPSNTEIGAAIGLPGGGFTFPHGTIFDRLRDKHVKFRIYADDAFPNVAELKGVSVVYDIDEYENFAEDVASPSYDAAYTFIEPRYDVPSYDEGNSQHPSGSVAAGERLIKATYEALRRSPIWDKSALVIVWDEHGGFYDHVAPGAAPATGDIGRSHGFTFDHLGPRVPAVIVSPLAPKNVIEHRVLEHSAIPASLERMFGLGPLTDRSSQGSGINHLLYLKTPRTDTPLTLPAVAAGSVAPKRRIALKDAVARNPSAALVDDAQSSFSAVILSAVAQHLEVAPADQHDAILARARSLRTEGDLLAYMKEVHALVVAARAKAGITRSATVRTRVPV